MLHIVLGASFKFYLLIGGLVTNMSNAKQGINAAIMYMISSACTHSTASFVQSSILRLPSLPLHPNRLHLAHPVRLRAVGSNFEQHCTFADAASCWQMDQT